MNTARPKREIPGTVPFDGNQARKGYALNKMCFSFNSAANRAEFLRDGDAYAASYGLNSEQREAVRKRDVLQMIVAGGTPITWPSWPEFSASTCRTSVPSRPE